MVLSSLLIAKHFCSLRDRRRNHRNRHLLMDIIVIALCATICCANDWQQIVIFTQRRHDWLKNYLALPNGIPSHDPFERVFGQIDPQAFLVCFQIWVEALTRGLGFMQIAIDGNKDHGREERRSYLIVTDLERIRDGMETVRAHCLDRRCCRSGKVGRLEVGLPTRESRPITG